MMLGAAEQQTQAKLKAVLQEGEAGKLEELAAALIGNLLGVTVAVAKSGFQHGGDAGPAGRQGRRLRVECKRYADTTSLSDRELLGEVDHALGRDPALEAWILVATREVPEQVEQDLNNKGESIGVPIVILDFKASGASSLAALCSHAPELVEQLFSREAGDLARALKDALGDTLERLNRELAAWRLGFSSLRDRSLQALETIWNEPRASTAAIGQNAAGGAAPKRIRRRGVHDRLDDWWSGPARNDAPAALVGRDGVGKTWAGVDWLVDRQDWLPIVLVVPSSAVAGTAVSGIGMKRFIADRLYELAGVRDREHWLRRLENLLKRPEQEGPAVTIFFDGLNQESSFNWLSLLKSLQAEPFAGRLRVMISTRRLHYETKLSELRGLVVTPSFVPVDGYDAGPGGELDQMLAMNGLTRAALNRDLLELARTPRLFRLIVRLHDRLADAGQVTIHRLLWEYGRDTLGDRAGRSFSETEWREWLGEIARQYREGVRTFSLKTLGETASRPDLSQHEVFARLSDIVDGQFAVPETLGGELRLRPTIVAHALGAALLNLLESTAPSTFEAIDAVLNQWLDPIADFDQRAEILRAAASIWLERRDTESAVGGVLVTAWLQTQNVADEHRLELSVLAPNIPDALLDAIEHSDPRTHASARSWAIHALRSIERTNKAALAAMVQRLAGWCGIVSRERSLRQNNADFDRGSANRFVTRIGIDEPGPVEVLGVTIQLFDDDDASLGSLVPTILEGFPLADVGPVFKTAAVATAVGRRDESWRRLKWLVLLNETDPAETASLLRDLSAAIRTRTPEPAVNPQLAARVGALLLWMIGTEQDDIAAVNVDPGLDRVLEYDRDYLAHPTHSFFPLERRHAAEALSDTSLRLVLRLQRTRDLWFDPTFELPQCFVNELRAAAAEIDVNKLDGSSGTTVEDHAFEEAEPALARCAPDLLAELARRKIREYANRNAEQRYWVAIHATSHFVLVGPVENAAARQLRERYREGSATNELYAASQLLILELKNEPAVEQAALIVKADQGEFLTDVSGILRPLATEEADTLIERFAGGSPSQRRNLLFVLANDSVEFSDPARRWLGEIAFGDDKQMRGIAHRALALSNARCFGGDLLSRDWSWSPSANHWENDYGTDALIEGTIQLPFDQVAPRLAPWRLLEAARRRGADPTEVRLACAIVGRVLGASRLEHPDPGANLSVDRSREHVGLFRYSVSPRDADTDSIDSAEHLRRAFDTESHIRAHQRAADIAVERVESARSAGADLYLADVAPEDMEIAVIHCPDLVARWLEGSDDRTNDFARRVHLAEGAYLSLCEALLKTDPVRGVSLFTTLRQTFTTRFTGRAGIDEFLDIAFRVPDSPEVHRLRNEQASLASCHSDEALLNLALAAALNGKGQWITGLIAEDEASALEWRQRRAIVLEGFTSGNDLPVEGAWPDGEIETVREGMRRKSARHRYNEACARHWWNAYLAASNEAEAYAAWVLFLRSADRRAWTWVGHGPETSLDNDTFCQVKIQHFRLNRSRLDRAIEKREEKLDRQFLDRDIAEGFGPWS
jgi:hypothetical protein